MLVPFPFPVPVSTDSVAKEDYYREKAREIRERREKEREEKRQRERAEKKAKRDAELAAKKVVDDARAAKWNAAIAPIIAADETITLE